jgi:transposase
VDIVRKLDGGTPVMRLSDEFGVGISTVYDMKNQKEQLLKAFADSDVQLQVVFG